LFFVGWGVQDIAYVHNNIIVSNVPLTTASDAHKNNFSIQLSNKAILTNYISFLALVNFGSCSTIVFQSNQKYFVLWYNKIINFQTKKFTVIELSACSDLVGAL